MAEIRDLGEYLENRGVFPEQPWKKRGTVSCGEKGKMYIAQTGDIMHAVEQLEATLRYFNMQRCSELDSRARVVTSRSIPGSITKGDFERARVRFNKIYNCKLKRIKPSCPDTPVFG